MAHKFPKFKFKNDEPIAHEEINYNLRTVKEEISGRINEHNVEDGCFYNREHAEVDFALHVNNEATAVDHCLKIIDTNGVADGSALDSYPHEYLIVPATYTDDRVVISGNSEWQVLVSLEKFTGNSLLWILASFQQQLYEAGYGDHTGGQYAIRLDGTVIDETVTGGLDRSNDSYGESTKCQAYGFVTDLVIPVAPGYHLIELVGRVPKKADWDQPSEDEITNIFNRELIILTLDPENEAVDGGTSTFTPLEEGDTIDAATIRAPYDAIVADVNALDYPAIQPKSLNSNHIPSTVVNSGRTNVGTIATSTYTNIYDRYANDTIGSPGWAVFNDGTDDLFVDTISPIDLTDVTIAGVLIGVDVSVISVDPDPAVTTFSNKTYGTIALQFRDENGLWHTVGKTERYVNSDNDPATLTQLTLRKNLGFRTFLTIDDIAPYSEVNGLRVVVAGCNRALPGDVTTAVTVVLQQGSIWFAALQAGA